MIQVKSLPLSLTSFSPSSSSAADKMHDLDPVTVTNRGRGPVIATYHVSVQFDGDPFRGKRKFVDEFRKVEIDGDRSRFSIEADLYHTSIVTTENRKLNLSRSNDLAKLDLFAAGDRPDEQCGTASIELRQLQMNLCEAVSIGPGVKYDRSKH